MNVFVTGAAGGVGQALIPLLLEQGHRVAALVGAPTELPGCRTILGDLEHVDKVAAEVAVCDAVVHLASPRSADLSVVLQQELVGTAGLADAWRRGPLVYASSAAIYARQQSCLRESAPVAPRTWYGRAKYANELQLRLAERRRGRQGAAIFRPAMVIGGHGRHPSSRLLGQILHHCRQGTRFVFDAEGLETYGCSFIGGDDFCRLVAAALTGNPSGTYNVASGFCTWRELIETIDRAAGTKSDFVVRADTRPQGGEYRLPQSRIELDTTALTSATGFTANQTLEALIADAVRVEHDANRVIRSEDGHG